MAHITSDQWGITILGQWGITILGTGEDADVFITRHSQKDQYPPDTTWGIYDYNSGEWHYSGHNIPLVKQLKRESLPAEPPPGSTWIPAIPEDQFYDKIRTDPALAPLEAK